ncbi:MAG: insulinase family protein [Acidobacteriota bacterium]|jgi:zinc protease
MKTDQRLFVVCLALLGLALVSPVWGQQEVADPQAAATAPLDAEMPVDPAVRTGNFDNGLTYYIRANRRPENRAEVRLVVNAGSVLEDDDQRGMAHLLEHMAFNGTEHFEKHELVEFMESIGMRLGPDVNAYTSFDETVYMLQVPTDDSEYLATAFQIMEDWSHAVTLDDAEIDAERGVVVEEWRLGQGASARMNEQQFPIIFKDSQYAERLPIGTEESIQTASHEAIRRFYHDWYRPDLMAVIAVGDFDPDQVELLMRQHFAGLAPAADPRPRTMYQVPDQPGTDFAIATDPEAPNTSVAVFYRMDTEEEGTLGDYRRSLVEFLYNTMLNARFQEIAQQADPPIVFGASAKGAMVRTKDMYQLFAGVPADGVERGLDTLLTEAARVERFGFTASELERAKANMMRGIERAYDDRANRRSSSFVSEYTRAFLQGEPIPGLEYEYELYQRFVPEITLQEVDEIGRDWISDSNRVVLVNAPENDAAAIPGEDELLAVLDSAADKELTAYEDSVSDAPLLPEIPDPGAIVSTSRVDDLDITEWTLSNGAKVVLKPTDLRDDQILFSATSPGGTSLASDEDYTIAFSASALVNISGLGDFNLVDLQKKLAGVAASTSASIGEFSEGLSGQASPKDLEALFQLIYLRFTAPRIDPQAVEAYLAQGRAVLENQEATPAFQFNKRMLEVRWQNNPRRQAQTAASLDDWDAERSFEFYKQRFADAGDFTFFFVGKFDLDTLRPLVERYLASLPATGREETWRDVGVRHVEGRVNEVVHAGIEPQSTTRVYFTGPFEQVREQRVVLPAMALVLQNRLRDVLREELSGTYGVSVSGSQTWRPIDRYTVTISFGSDPGRADELTDVVFSEIDRLMAAPPEESEVADVRASFLRSHETDQENNSYWLNNMVSAWTSGRDIRNILTYEDVVESITPEMIQAAAQQYLGTDNVARFTLLPVEGQ